MLPKGTIRIRGDGRAYVKCVDHEAFGTTWVPRAHFVWWKYRRELVPKGKLLHHKDENKLRDVMSNLQLMTKSEHSTHHNLHARSSEKVQKKRTKSMQNYYKTKTGQLHMERMTTIAFSKPSAVKAMVDAIKTESRSKEGRKRRSILCKQMWTDGRMKATSEEMRRRYLCSKRAQKLGQV